jgi:thiamine-phosphate pyrophosphorylase
VTRLRGPAASPQQARPDGSAAAAAPARGDRSSGAVGRAHFVTDRRRYHLSIDELGERIVRAASAGADVVQVRERDLPDAELAALVRRVVAATASSGARVLVNDRFDVAIAGGAAGVHLRGDSAPASRVRAIVPAGFLIGRSVHSLADVDAAVADGGCDYLMFGTVFPSSGKPDRHPVAGLDALAAACRRSPLPVIAIGGITRGRVSDVLASGAAGFAAVDMFMCLTPLPEVV